MKNPNAWNAGKAKLYKDQTRVQKYFKAIYRWLTWADFDRRMGATPWRKFARAFFVRWSAIFVVVLAVMVACSADGKPETGILIEQQQRHTDGHRLHAEDCKVPDFTLSDAYSFTATEAAGDFTVDLRDLIHCSDRSHNALVDMLQSEMVEF